MNLRQSLMQIAYQGEPGAFSEAAARQVAAAAELVACRHFDDVFAAVEAGTVACGVLPIENSIGGSIHRNFDLMLQHALTIVGEIELPVVHHLLALPGSTLGKIRRVYSHPQALAQCDRFLRSLSGIEVIATYDTAGSAKLVADGQLRDAAAIASARAGEVFGLVSLQASIQDVARNTTRFLVLAKEGGFRPEVSSPAGTGSARTANKTSIVFTLPNEAGALFKALSVFALRGIDLSKLESRPIVDRKWEYLFYADLIGDETASSRALAHLAEFATMMRVLGTYPRCQPATGDAVASRPVEATA